MLKNPVVWYAKSRVGLKTLTKWVKNMVVNLPGCENGNYTNKTPRVTTITRLHAIGVPAELGMRVTGHLSREGYMRYDVESDSVIQKTLKNCIARVPGTGGDVSWKESLEYERKRSEECEVCIRSHC